MTTPHKHADLIKAWADGAEIEVLSDAGEWVEVYGNEPLWMPSSTYRVKPEPKKTVKRWQWVVRNDYGEYFEHDKFCTEAEMKAHAERYSYTIIKRLEHTELECMK